MISLGSALGGLAAGALFGGGGSGGGGQTQTTTTQIPAWLRPFVQSNLERAEHVAQTGYTPYYGPDVAALSPMQTQAMQSTGMGMQAFGLAPQGFDPMAGMPQPQTFMGGLQGYSSGGLFDNAVQQLQERRPAQYDHITGMFIDPVTGDIVHDFTTPEQVVQMAMSGGGAPSYVGDYSGGGGETKNYTGGSVGTGNIGYDASSFAGSIMDAITGPSFTNTSSNTGSGVSSFDGDYSKPSF